MKPEKKTELLEKLRSPYKILDIEETDIYADSSMSHGDAENWGDEVLLEFNKKVDPVQTSMKQIWQVIKIVEVM